MVVRAVEFIEFSLSCLRHACEEAHGLRVSCSFEVQSSVEAVFNCINGDALCQLENPFRDTIRVAEKLLGENKIDVKS